MPVLLRRRGVQVLLNLIDHSLDLTLVFTASLAAVLLAVQQLVGVAEDHLKATGDARVLRGDELDAVAKLRDQFLLQAVVKPRVPSASTVHDLVARVRSAVCTGGIA